jgi:hypothetical protein
MKQEIKTIAEQIDYRELVLAGFKFVYDDNETSLKLVKGKKQLVIKYNHSTDLYVLNKITIKKNFDFDSVLMGNMYHDQLKEQIEDFFKFEYVMQGLKIVGVNC